MTFLEKINNLILDNYPTYPPWAEAIGLFLLSNMNHKAYLPGGGKGIPLTINPMIIGPSRMIFKSMAMSIINPILKECNIPYAQKYTSEKFTTDAQETYKKQGYYNCAIIRDETAGLISDLNKKYLSDGLTFLSQLLSPGVIQKNNTFTHGVEGDIPCRINFISACTVQIFSIIDEGFWTQGLGNRLYTIFVTKKILDQMYACPNRGDSAIFDLKLNECISILRKQVKTNVETIRYTKEVEDLVIKTEFIKRQRCLKAYFDDMTSILPAYEYESQVAIQKVAALKAIDEQIGIKEPVVTLDHYKYGEKLITERFEEFKLMINAWKNFREGMTSKVRGLTIREKILAYIKTYGSMTLTQLNNNISGEAVKKKMEVQAMAELGELKVIIDTNKGTKTYVIPNYHNTGNSDLYENSNKFK